MILSKDAYREKRVPEIAAALRIPVEQAARAFDSENTRRLVNLWMRKRGVCHWCKHGTIVQIGRDENRGGKPAGNVATRDHLKSRLSGRKPGKSCRVVLSCYSCNQQRNDIEVKVLAGKPVASSLIAKFAPFPNGIPHSVRDQLLPTSS